VDRVTEDKTDGKDTGRGRERKKHGVRMCDRKGAKERAGIMDSARVKWWQRRQGIRWRETKSLRQAFVLDIFSSSGPVQRADGV